jgi:hypothetical protein
VWNTVLTHPKQQMGKIVGRGNAVAHLALLRQHAWHDLVEEANQLEHGVVRQMLLRKFPLWPHTTRGSVPRNLLDSPFTLIALY